jgi:DNA-binding transcriptional ArsR family regulator
MPHVAKARVASGSVFTLLAHPERRRLLLLLGRGDAPSGALARAAGVSWPQASRHLSRLEAARVVTVRRRGRERIYRLQRARLRALAEAWLAAL